MTLEVAILAAGKGTRMNSDLPKVLHEVGGRPMLEHVLETADALGADAIHVVYGHGGEQVPARIGRDDVDWVLQEEQLGTGHALQQVLPRVDPGATLLVLYGDVPLVRPGTLVPLAAAEDGIALLTVELDNPSGMGRILRGRDGKVTGIVEEKDADGAQRAINEINTGFMAAPARRFAEWLGRLDNDNAQGEYYLTDVIGLAVAGGLPVLDFQPTEAEEVLGVNSRDDLARVEAIWRRRQAAGE